MQLCKPSEGEKRHSELEANNPLNGNVNQGNLTGKLKLLEIVHQELDPDPYQNDVDSQPCNLRLQSNKRKNLLLTLGRRKSNSLSQRGSTPLSVRNFARSSFLGMILDESSP